MSYTIHAHKPQVALDAWLAESVHHRHPDAAKAGWWAALSWVGQQMPTLNENLCHLERRLRRHPDSPLDFELFMDWALEAPTDSALEVILRDGAAADFIGDFHGSFPSIPAAVEDLIDEDSPLQGIEPALAWNILHASGWIRSICRDDLIHIWLPYGRMPQTPLEVEDGAPTVV